jgi:gas vesicle protein
VKNSHQVAGGVVGAVVGFVATLLILELVGFGNRADPIMSGKTPGHFSVTA